MFLAVLVLANVLALAILVRPPSSSADPQVPATTTTRAAPPAAPVPTRVGEQDGILPDGTTVFDDRPGVAGLDHELLRALRDAATDAAGNGITILVNSGWRSAAYQDRLLRDAVARYGSLDEAARWVATPDTSLHVSGDAADIGGADAAAWLARHGDRYGLCRTYANEPWHYELRPDAADLGCPRPYADPTEDPRLRP
jgi:LAS superfamily LD-carboxypeptidase LdcB